MQANTARRGNWHNPFGRLFYPFGFLTNTQKGMDRMFITFRFTEILFNLWSNKCELTRKDAPLCFYDVRRLCEKRTKASMRLEPSIVTLIQKKIGFLVDNVYDCDKCAFQGFFYDLIFHYSRSNKANFLSWTPVCVRLWLERSLHLNLCRPFNSASNRCSYLATFIRDVRMKMLPPKWSI